MEDRRLCIEYERTCTYVLYIMFYVYKAGHTIFPNILGFVPSWYIDITYRYYKIYCIVLQYIGWLQLLERCASIAVQLL